jgi:hypothetical protein
VVQDRDRRLLIELGVMRIIDRESAKVVAGFTSTRRANDRLLNLTRAGLLKRFFVGGVAHGRKAIYTLSPKGADHVAAKFGGIQRPQGRLVVGDAFVEHQAGINQIYVDVKFRPSPKPQIRFLRWQTFRQPISDAIKLTPDGYFELVSQQMTRPMFLEVDRGTEALPIWQKKTASYVQLALSGEFQKRFRNPQFRVLVVATSDRRINNIRATVAKSTDKIFWFSTFENINRDGLFSSVWLRPTGDQRLPLL